MNLSTMDGIEALGAMDPGYSTDTKHKIISFVTLKYSTHIRSTSSMRTIKFILIFCEVELR